MLYEIANSVKLLYAQVDEVNQTATLYKRKDSSEWLNELTYISFAAGDPQYGHTLCDAHLPVVDYFPPAFGLSTFYPFHEMRAQAGEPQLGVKIFDNSKVAFLAIKVRCSHIDIVTPWQVLLRYTPGKPILYSKL